MNNKENKEDIINYFPGDDYEDDDDNLLSSFGIPYKSDLFQEISTEVIEGVTYYKKKHEMNTPVLIWNELYGENGLIIKLGNAHYDSKSQISYFPEFGGTVPKGECKVATMSAQGKLNNIGYHHYDLYDGDSGYYNCTNVRKYNNEYYAIDTEKITQNLLHKTIRGGNKKKRTRRKKPLGKKKRKSKKVKRVGKSKKINKKR